MTTLAQKIYLIFIKNIFSKQNILTPITKDNITDLIEKTGGSLICDPAVSQTMVTIDSPLHYTIRYNTNPIPIYDICFFWCQVMLSLNENGDLQKNLKDDTTTINLCKELTVHMLLPEWYFREMVKQSIKNEKINLTQMWKNTGIPISVLRLRGNQLRYWTV